VRRALTALLTIASSAFVASPSPALANGRFPAAQLVQLSPDGQSVALRLTFGFALSEDGGQTFRWLCEDVLGYGAGAFDPSFTMDDARRLYVGAPDGLARASADRCSHERVAQLEREFVIDLDRSADGRTVLAITSSGAPTARNRVWRSDDGGGTFAPLGEGFGPETLFETVELARSDARRVYATAVRNNPRSVRFMRSDDGGATLSDSSLDVHAIEDAFVAAIDPTNADVVYVRARLSAPPDPDAGSGASPTTLLVSRDGGQSFREIARTVGAMNGFAISDDGATLWIGSTHAADGLRQSTDRGASWQRVSDTRVTGLRFDRGTLWIAANWVLDRFALGRSTDGGRTIVPALADFCALRGAPECPATSDVTTVCAARWSLYRAATLGCSASPTPDASLPPPMSDAAIEAPVTAAPGCRCATPSAPASSPPFAALTALAALATLARRRQRAPERCA
jgi:MYXO-CTERM domain-containing protein